MAGGKIGDLAGEVVGESFSHAITVCCQFRQPTCSSNPSWSPLFGDNGILRFARDLLVMRVYADGEWEAIVMAKPLGKREIASLKAYFDADGRLNLIAGAPTPMSGSKGSRIDRGAKK
jgi:hypothetical protein